MRKFVTTLAAVSTLAVLTACGAQPPGYTNIFGKWAMQFDATPVQKEARSYAGSVQGGAYNQALYTATMEHANYEFDQMEDWRDSMFHARNAITVAQGGTYQPTELSGPVPNLDPPGYWRLPADKVEELTSARARLVAALGAGAPQSNPEPAAKALAFFNCWVEQQEENFQPRDIAYCRDGFYANLELIEVKRSQFPEVVGLQADVFFDFDRSNIRPDARPILDDLARLLVQDTSVQVLVWGHTDTVGTTQYNQGLSERRARSVASYLTQRGVTANRMSVQGFGETRLAVPTPDQTPEPRNRRVEIRRR